MSSSIVPTAAIPSSSIQQSSMMAVASKAYTESIMATPTNTLSQLDLFDLVYRSRSVIMDMLRIRGYDTTPHETFTEPELRRAYDSVPRSGNKDHICLDFHVVNPETTAKCYVLYTVTDKQIRTKIRDYIQRIYSEDNPLKMRPRIDEVIVLGRDEISQAVEKIIHELHTTYHYNITYFQLKSLIINPMTHVLVPYHRVVRKDEEAEVLRRSHVETKEQLPRILPSDPIAKFIGLKHGQIVEIHRKSETAGINIVYRFCSTKSIY
jgi:DNA-directed RNA polymerase I, II, and III subunit RPABC1